MPKISEIFKIRELSQSYYQTVIFINEINITYYVNSTVPEVRGLNTTPAWSFISQQVVLDFCSHSVYDFGGLGVSVLASGTQVRRFKPGRSRRIFRAKNILSTPSFGGEVKPSVPCRTLRHVKDPKMAWKSSFRLNLPDNIIAHSSIFRY